MNIITRYEQRMYFFVPYNISPIQQAIQAGHAAQQYDYKYKDDKDLKNFILYDKTWIILNGGTTNSGTLGHPKGTLQEFYEAIRDNGINYAIFNEPDLNDALTSICFLADERVWDYETYPDIIDYMKDKMTKMQWLETFKNGKIATWRDVPAQYGNDILNWVDSIGGEKNVFLRELIKYKKLA